MAPNIHSFICSETMEWITTPTTGRQPEPCSFHSCSAVGNRVIVFGGRSQDNAHFDDLNIFDTGKSAFYGLLGFLPILFLLMH